MARSRRIVSNSAADRAGQVYREWAALPAREQAQQYLTYLQALQTIRAYRDMHGYPLTKVTMGVRSMVRTATRDERLRPGQRHKRTPRILAKLRKLPRMRLSQMEDIGGCRAVLPTLEAVYAVSERVLRQWGETAQLTDYIAEPKDDGYRGLHIVVRRDGRLIEVQLRTEGQDDWAKAIEEYGPRIGYDLKDGEGPADVRLYFKLAANRIARVERGEVPDPALEEQFARVRRQVIPYFQRG